MTAAMILLVWARLRRIERLVVGLIVAIQAGRVRPRRVGVARVRADPVAVPRALPRLPRRFAWLLPMVPYEAAGFASQLRHLLGDPEMAALLAASPRLGELLRPLCRMLGLEAGLVAARTPVARAVLDVAPEAVHGERIRRSGVALDAGLQAGTGDGVVVSEGGRRIFGSV